MLQCKPQLQKEIMEVAFPSFSAVICTKVQCCLVGWCWFKFWTVTLIYNSNSGLLCRESFKFWHTGFLQSPLDWKTTLSKLQTIKLMKLIAKFIDVGGFQEQPLVLSLRSFHWCFLFLTNEIKRSCSQEWLRSSWSFPCRYHQWSNSFSLPRNCTEGRNIFLSTTKIRLASVKSSPRLQKAVLVCLCKRWGLCITGITREDFLAFSF